MTRETGLRYVTFTDTERLIGNPSKKQAAMNPCNTVFDAKRLIGLKFDDQIVQNDVHHRPFKVVKDRGKPKIQAEYKGEMKTLAPMVLTKVKKTAEAHLGQKVINAVIAVPAY